MKTFALMAGGTAGHLFPAMSLAEELRRRGHAVILMTDERVGGQGGAFPAREVLVIPSATPSIRNPWRFFLAGLRITRGIGVATLALRRIRPDAAVGFGGYPVFPPFLAAFLLGIPGILHEQNAVMGRANRALARFAKAIALSFVDTRFTKNYANKTVPTGNPVRERVREAAESFAYSAPDNDGPLRLVVFGGSQGARAFAELVPPAIALLPDDLRRRILVTQQCRAEDLDRVTAAYREMKVSVELGRFFEDLPERMICSHLVICRSGASSVAELSVLGVPAILVPLPGALDADQKANGLVFESAGGGWLIEQANLSPQSLANRLTELFNTPDLLRQSAARAKQSGRPDAVLRLAELAETIAGRLGRS